jgi:transcriptional regulator with XRE-family HTH domain
LTSGPSSRAGGVVPDAQRARGRQRLREDLGARLRKAREESGIGLRELARRIGVSPSMLSQIETGKSEPSISTLFTIVSELSLPVNEIVFDPSQASGAERAAMLAIDNNEPSLPRAKVQLASCGIG